MTYRCDFCEAQIVETDHEVVICAGTQNDDGIGISVPFGDNGCLEIKATFQQTAAVHYHEECLRRLAFQELAKVAL